MDPKTDEHLRAAERHRDFARALIDPAATGSRPPPWEWVAVVAFYAAVHYVNAYLWESSAVAPATHGERTTRVRRDRALRRCRVAYGHLNTLGWQARYEPTFMLSEQDARALVGTELRAVEVTVMLALNLPAPTW